MFYFSKDNQTVLSQCSEHLNRIPKKKKKTAKENVNRCSFPSAMRFLVPESVYWDKKWAAPIPSGCGYAVGEEEGAILRLSVRQLGWGRTEGSQPEKKEAGVKSDGMEADTSVCFSRRQRGETDMWFKGGCLSFEYLWAPCRHSASPISLMLGRWVPVAALGGFKPPCSRASHGCFLMLL